MEQGFVHFTKIFLNKKKKEVAESTFLNYEYYIDKFLIPYFWKKNMECITVEDVSIFKDELTKKFSNQVARNIYSLLKQILDLAVIEGVIETNYARLLKIEKANYDLKDKEKNLILTELEIEKICNYCKEDLTIGIGVLLALKLGIRKGEVISLQWKDIDLENSYIKINSTIKRCRNDKENMYFKKGKTKTKFSKREIPLNSDLKRFLEEYRKEYKIKFSLNEKSINKCYLVYSNDPTNFVSPNKIDYYFKKLKQNCGLNESIHFHSLRHTFINKCIIEKKIPLSVVKYIVGHSSSTSITIDTYTHINKEIIDKYKEEI